MNSIGESIEKPELIALALSGGGSRAIAFHLGGLRALHDLGVLDKVRVLSTVSGGSVIGALYAYSDEPFADFEARVICLLEKGLERSIARTIFFSSETPKIALTFALAIAAGLAAAVLAAMSFAMDLARLRRLSKFLRRAKSGVLRVPIFGSASTAFEQALSRSLFGAMTLGQVKRANLEVVINASEVTTGTAFRFGSVKSGAWRFGAVIDNRISVAKAVAASAAYPIFLPFLTERFLFRFRGQETSATIALSDGGIYDNLGVSAIMPGRDADHSLHTYSPTHVISLNAGAGQWTPEQAPFWLLGRAAKSFDLVHRKAQDSWYEKLHALVANGTLDRFLMVYLGQIDERLPVIPSDLVRREEVRAYPTDFAPMPRSTIDLLSRRGEQLTRLLHARYW